LDALPRGEAFERFLEDARLRLARHDHVPAARDAPKFVANRRLERRYR
jgi:hypothetical protein